MVDCPTTEVEAEHDMQIMASSEGWNDTEVALATRLLRVMADSELPGVTDRWTRAIDLWCSLTP